MDQPACVCVCILGGGLLEVFFLDASCQEFEHNLHSHGS